MKRTSKIRLSLLLAIATASIPFSALAGKAYLEITLKIAPENRAAAGAVYTKFKSPFLSKITGAQSKELLIRDEDVQVLHSFDTVEHAKEYLDSTLFKDDVVTALKPLLQAAPEVRIYSAD
jgi:hypothetical protein